MSDRITIHHGDSRDVLKTIADSSIDSVVCDPPYALVSIVKRFGGANAAEVKPGSVYARASTGFMGQSWDTGETAFDPAFWAEALRVLKPGGHVVAFGGSRSYGRLQVAIEDAGFEVRDGLVELAATDAAVLAFMQSLSDEQLRAFIRCIDDSQFGGLLAWIYGSGFPKSHDTERAIATTTCPLPGRHFARSLPRREDRLLDDHVCPQTTESTPWDGFGTALKPAIEPIILARKPLDGTVAANVLRWGVGALNIDGCRIAADAPRPAREAARRSGAIYGAGLEGSRAVADTDVGRWPANVMHDGSAEVVAAFPDAPGQQRGVSGDERSQVSVFGAPSLEPKHYEARDDSGSAARFFYTAKADAEDRMGSKHPTVKPVDLMRWLVRLVTPPGGLVLDPFAGSGTTGVAAIAEGMRAVLIEREADYVADIRRRVDIALGQGEQRGRAKARRRKVAETAGPLFGGDAA